MTDLLVLADIGITALWLLLSWLGAAIICSELSKRKGYGEKPGLGTGLLLSVLGVLVWLVIPARENSLAANKKARKKAAAA